MRLPAIVASLFLAHTAAAQYTTPAPAGQPASSAQSATPSPTPAPTAAPQQSPGINTPIFPNAPLFPNARDQQIPTRPSASPAPAERPSDKPLPPGARPFDYSVNLSSDVFGAN